MLRGPAVATADWRSVSIFASSARFPTGSIVAKGAISADLSRLYCGSFEGIPDIGLLGRVLSAASECPLCPSIADFPEHCRHVRFVPKADSCTAAISAKLKRGNAYRQLARLIPVWTKAASRRRGPSSIGRLFRLRDHTDSSSPMSVMRNENGRR